MEQEKEPLKVASVIGDPTRYAIYQYIASSGVERVTAQEIAAKFDLHPNVARLHLNKLKDIGLLEAHTEKSGRGGRPGTAYSLADKVLTLHFPPRDYRLLAELLSQALTKLGDQGREILEEVGRDYGRQLVEPAEEDLRLSPEALESVAQALARHGIQAEVIRDDGGAVNLILRNCNFKEVATHYPKLVCQLCENIVRGVVNAHLRTSDVHEEASLPHGDKFCVYVADGE